MASVQFRVSLLLLLAASACPAPAPKGTTPSEQCGNPAAPATELYGRLCSGSKSCETASYCNGLGQCVDFPGDPAFVAPECTVLQCGESGLAPSPAADGSSCFDLAACQPATCQQGACTPGGQPVLDDGDPCTLDLCGDEPGAVVHRSLPPDLCQKLKATECNPAADPLASSAAISLKECLDQARTEMKTAALAEAALSLDSFFDCTERVLCSQASAAGPPRAQLALSDSGPSWFECKDRNKVEKAMKDCETGMESAEGKCLLALGPGAGGLVTGAGGLADQLRAAYRSGRATLLALITEVCMLWVAHDLGACYERAVRDAAIEGPCGNGGTCCAGSCADLNTDLANCGKCGNQCLSGQSCVGGKCQCAGWTVIGGTCTAGLVVSGTVLDLEKPFEVHMREPNTPPQCSDLKLTYTPSSATEGNDRGEMTCQTGSSVLTETYTGTYTITGDLPCGVLSLNEFDTVCLPMAGCGKTACVIDLIPIPTR